MGLGKTYSTKYLADSNNNTGVAGQVLSATSTGIDWVDANTVPGAGLWLENGNDIYNSNSGNVGIGATSSSHKLLVSSSDNNVLKLINEELNYNANQQSILFQGVWWDGNPGALTNTARIAGTHRSNGYHSGGLNFYSYNNGAEVGAMAIIYNGNVGIGTNSPGAKLTIKGSDSLNAFKITDSGDGDGFKVTSHTTQGTYVQIYDAAHTQTIMLDARSDSTARHTYFNGGGNVGIGTASPAAKLDVSDGTIYSIKLSNSAAYNSGVNNGIVFNGIYNSSGNNTDMASIRGGKETVNNTDFGGKLTFHTRINGGVDTERMRITSTGHLQVSTGYFELTSQPTTKLWLSTNQVQLYAGNLLVFGGYNASNDSVVIGNESGDVNVTLAGGANNKVLYLEGSSGNVGIGTKTPGSKLDIQGTQGQLFSVTDDLSGSIFAVSDISGVPIFDVNSSGVSYFDGNVGIGTDSPYAITHINGPTPTGTTGYSDNANSGQLYITSNAGAGTSQLGGRIAFGGIAGNGGGAFTGTRQDSVYGTIEGYKSNTTPNNAGGGLSFKTNFNNTGVLTERMNIAQDGKVIIPGNVGIGITSPTNPLTVDFAPYGIGSITTSNNATAWNTSSAVMLRGASGSNGLGFGISGTANDRKSWIQSGHPSQQYANYLGTLAINPLGGNVGIGATDPASKLNVASTGTNPYSATLDSASNMKGIRNVLTSNTDDMVGIYFATGTTTTGTHWSGITGSRSDNASHWGTQLNFYTHNNDIANLNHATQKMVIKGDGNVGIGVTAPLVKLHVNQGNTSGTVIKASGIQAQIEIQTSTAGDAHLYMRPNTTGNNAAIFKMTAGTNYNWRWQDDATTPVVFMQLSQSNSSLSVKGDIIAYGSPSDERYKENIKPIESALDKAVKLQGVTFDWKESDSILDIKEDIGFIAQDVQKVVPELVRENEDGKLSLRYQGVTPILLEAIKELKAEIDLLKSKPCNCNNCNCSI
jgi:hypothetical protein